MNIDHPRGETVSLRGRARASVFSTIAFVIVAVGVALVLVTTSADPTLPPTAGPTTTEMPVETTGQASAAAPADRSEVAVDPGAASEVSVQVANSTAVAGAAGRLTDDLKALGYVTFTPTNDVSGAAALTKIHHRDGFLLQAQALATSIGLDPGSSVFPLPIDPSATIADYGDPAVLVVLGTDLAG